VSTNAQGPNNGSVVRLIAVVLAIALVWNLVGNLVLPGAWYVPANLVVAGLLVGLARRSGLDNDSLALRRNHVRSGIGVGLAAMAVVAVALALALELRLGEGLFEDEAVLDDSTFERWFVPVVRIPLGTVVFEELLFRSVLLGALLTSMRTSRAVVSSAVAFGLWHIVPSLEGADGSTLSTVGEISGIVAVTTLAGVAFAFLRLWSQSVVAPMLAHVATNTFAYVAALVALDVLL